MNQFRQVAFWFILICTVTANAQLTVTVSPPKVMGQKTVVELAMTNSFPKQIQSARAVCFVLDQQGKMVGQSSKWVIGSTKDRLPMQPKTGATFNFVITSPQPLTTTNLTAKISFNRLILEGNQIADASKMVSVISLEK